MTVKVTVQITTTTSVLFTSVCAPSGELNFKIKNVRKNDCKSSGMIKENIIDSL